MTKTSKISEKMTNQCQAYFEEAIKKSCNDEKWDNDFDDENFVAQCFDDIQNEIMREYYGADYYHDSIYEDGQIGKDYELTADIRTDFTREALEYLEEAKKSFKE